MIHLSYKNNYITQKDIPLYQTINWTFQHSLPTGMQPSVHDKI